MTTLPSDIWLEIFTHLPQRYLLLVSQTCSSFAALTKPLRFSTLVLHGDPQASKYYADSSGSLTSVLYAGRARSVALSSLHATVEELLTLDLVRHAKRLEWGPKIYTPGFWTRYRQMVIESVDEEINIHEIGEEEEDFEDDEEFGYVGMRRIAAERQARPEQERPAVEAAEKIWDEKVGEQSVNYVANLAALVTLFGAMLRLNEVVITPWECNLEDHDLKLGFGHEYAELDPHGETAMLNLEMLSIALEASHSKPGRLLLPTIDPQVMASQSSLVALFGSLTSLSFNLRDLRFMTAASVLGATEFVKLIQCASDTLRELQFGNHTESHPQLPETEEHFLEKLFQDPQSDGSDTLAPLLLPRLKTFKLRSIILNSPSLIAFLSVQPALEYVEFEYVYLATIGYKWDDIAKSLPPSCQKFGVNHCGHERFSPTSPVAYNHIAQFKPYKELFPASVGWQASDAILQAQWDEIIRQSDRMWGITSHSVAVERKYQGKSKNEWIEEQRKMEWTQAEFERI